MSLPSKKAKEELDKATTVLDTWDSVTHYTRDSVTHLKIFYQKVLEQLANNTYPEANFVFIVNHTIGEELHGLFLKVLGENTNLQKLTISNVVMDYPVQHSLVTFFVGLKANKTLKELALHCFLTDMDMKQLCESLLQNKNIISLSLSKNNLTSNGFAYLVKFLENTKTLQHITLTLVLPGMCGSPRSKILAEALNKNTSIKRFNFYGNASFDDTFMKFIANILSKRTSILESLILDY